MYFETAHDNAIACSRVNLFYLKILPYRYKIQFLDRKITTPHTKTSKHKNIEISIKYISGW